MITFKEIQEKLDKEPALKFEHDEVIIKKYKTPNDNEKYQLREFLVQFFRNYNSIFWTIEVSSKQKQCAPERSRSNGDIYKIAKHYFPNVTYKVIYNSLRVITGIDNYWCPDVQKVVFFESRNNSSNAHIYLSKDEHGMKIEKELLYKIMGQKHCAFTTRREGEIREYFEAE